MWFESTLSRRFGTDFNVIGPNLLLEALQRPLNAEGVSRASILMRDENRNLDFHAETYYNLFLD